MAEWRNVCGYAAPLVGPAATLHNQTHSPAEWRNNGSSVTRVKLTEVPKHTTSRTCTAHAHAHAPAALRRSCPPYVHAMYCITLYCIVLYILLLYILHCYIAHAPAALRRSRPPYVHDIAHTCTYHTVTYVHIPLLHCPRTRTSGAAAIAPSIARYVPASKFRGVKGPRLLIATTSWACKNNE